MKNILTIAILFYTLSLFGASPNWVATTYDGTMTVVCVAEVNGVPIDNANSKIGVFKNEECRGVSSPIYHPVFRKYCFFLSISGSATVERLSLRIYSAEDDKVYEVEEKIEFILNGTAGTYNPEVYPAAFCREDYLITDFESDYQVMETEIVGDSIIRLYHDQSNDMSDVKIRFSTPSDKSKLKTKESEELISGFSRFNMNEANTINLYTENNLLVQQYKVEVVYAFATQNTKENSSKDINLKRYSKILEISPVGCSQITFRLWDFQGKMVMEGKSDGESTIQIQLPDANTRYVLEMYGINRAGEKMHISQKM